MPVMSRRGEHGRTTSWLMPGLDPGIQPEVPIAPPGRTALDHRVKPGGEPGRETKSDNMVFPPPCGEGSREGVRAEGECALQGACIDFLYPHPGLPPQGGKEQQGRANYRLMPGLDPGIQSEEPSAPPVHAAPDHREKRSDGPESAARLCHEPLFMLLRNMKAGNGAAENGGQARKKGGGRPGKIFPKGYFFLEKQLIAHDT